MQNQMSTDVNNLFSSFLNKPTQNTNTSSKTPQTYVPIRTTQNRAKTLHYLKALAIVGIAGISLYGIYSKGKKVGENKALNNFSEKFDTFKEDCEKIITNGLKKSKSEVNSKELDDILTQIKLLSSNDAKTQEAIQNVIKSLDKISTENGKTKTAFEETLKQVTEEISKIQNKQNNQIGQKEIDILKKAIEQNAQKSENAVKDLVEQNANKTEGVIKEIIGKAQTESISAILATKTNGDIAPEIVMQEVDLEPVLNAISNLSNKLTTKTALDTVSDKAILDKLNSLSDDIKNLDNDEISKFTNEILNNLEKLKNDNKLSEKTLIEVLSETAKDIKKGLVVNTTVEKTELSQENIEKIENAIKNTIENLKPVSAETVKKPYVTPELIIEKSNNEKIAKPVQKLLEEPSKSLLSDSSELSLVKFNKGVAYQENGEKYTGIINHTLKTGDTVAMEFKDGLITKSTKSKNNQTIFEKIYNRSFLSDKNIQKTTVTTKDNSDIERAYCSLEKIDTKNRSFNTIEKHLNDKVKKEITRYEANAKSQTLTKSLPDGQLIQTKMMPNTASKQIIQPATKYKNIGTDSQGYKVFKIDV